MTQPVNQDLYVVLMAGGSGTRLWPLSTDERPKQLIHLVENQSLIQLTFARTRQLVPPERTLILTNARFAELVRTQLPEVPSENVVAEPMVRDTAAAVGLATVVGQARFGGGTMVVLPADHIIEPVQAFVDVVRSAARGSGSGALYTFGITPTYPATGYGYLERGDEIADLPDHYQLQRFREKPDLETAQSFVDSGRFYWNSGMFVWQTDTIWSYFERLLPDHAARLAPLRDAFGQPGWDEALHQAFDPLEKISIDYGIMEKAKDVRTVEANFTWCDVGGWPALRDYMDSDGDGNAHRARLRSIDSKDNLVFSEDPEETVALIGMENVVVVRAGKKTLVMPESRAQDVKKMVQLVKEKEKNK